MHNRIKLLEYFGIQTLLDVGANTGQFAYYTRQLGYRNTIVSFEPMSSAYAVLQKFAKRDPNWQICNYAIGHTDGMIEINISANSVSSSILDMMPEHLRSAPDSAYEGKEQVAIHKIDSVIGDFVNNYDTTFMKIDTQGFEKNVIEGAENSIKLIKGLQVELSMVELYKGETLISDMITLIEDKGFNIYSLEPGFYDKSTGQLLQVDGIFFRK